MYTCTPYIMLQPVVSSFEPGQVAYCDLMNCSRTRLRTNSWKGLDCTHPSSVFSPNLSHILYRQAQLIILLCVFIASRQLNVCLQQVCDLGRAFISYCMVGCPGHRESGHGCSVVPNRVKHYWVQPLRPPGNWRDSDLGGRVKWTLVASTLSTL